MLWLKLLAGLLGFIFLNALLIKYKRAIPYLVVGYLALFYLGFKGKVSVGSINIFYWDVLFLLCIINIAYRIIIEGYTFNPAIKKVIFFFFAYFVYIELSEIYNFIASEDRHRLDDLIRTSIQGLYPLVLLAVYINLEEKDFEIFFKYTALCAIAVALWAIMKETFDIGTPAMTSSGTFRRMRGESIIFIQLGLIYFLYHETPHRVFRYAMIFIAFGGIVLVGHRSGFMSAGLILALYFLFFIKTGRMLKLLIFSTPFIAFGGILLIGVMLSGQVKVLNDFLARAGDTFNTENQTSDDRILKWKWALSSTMENPLGGTKLNLLPDWYGKYVLQADYGYLPTDVAHGRYLYLEGKINPWPPHNMFVNIVSQNGIIALVLFFLLVGAVVQYMWRGSTQKERFIKISGGLATFVFLFFNNHHSYDAVTGLFIAIFIIPVLYKDVVINKMPENDQRK